MRFDPFSDNIKHHAHAKSIPRDVITIAELFRSDGVPAR